MWNSLCAWIVAKFSKTIGIILTKIFSNSSSLIARNLANEIYNKKALQYVKELSSRDDLTNIQKSAEFNKRFIQWLEVSGKVLSDSTINLLREMAVAYYKSLRGK